jgi:hypothetical protein
MKIHVMVIMSNEKVDVTVWMMLMVLMRTMLKHLMFVSNYTVESTCSTSAKSDAMPTCALFVECGGVDKTMS